MPRIAREVNNAIEGLSESGLCVSGWQVCMPWKWSHPGSGIRHSPNWPRWSAMWSLTQDHYVTAFKHQPLWMAFHHFSTTMLWGNGQFCLSHKQRFPVLWQINHCKLPRAREWKERLPILCAICHFRCLSTIKVVSHNVRHVIYLKSQQQSVLGQDYCSVFQHGEEIIWQLRMNIYIVGLECRDAIWRQ